MKYIEFVKYIFIISITYIVVEKLDMDQSYIVSNNICNYNSPIYYSEYSNSKLFYKLMNYTKLCNDLYNSNYYSWKCELTNMINYNITLMEYSNEKLYSLTKHNCNTVIL
jgi:hypothetical protein